jgi:hypothetical protein
MDKHGCLYHRSILGVIVRPYFSTESRPTWKGSSARLEGLLQGSFIRQNDVIQRAPLGGALHLHASDASSREPPGFCT